MIYWFFGYPGVGKDFCAQTLGRLLACPYIDADDYLLEADLQVLKAGNFTVQQRLDKLERISTDIERALKTQDHLTIADSLPDELSRQFLLDKFGKNILLIRVVSDDSLHRQRLKNRKGHFFKDEMLDQYLSQHWQPVQKPHVLLVNNAEYATQIEDQLKDLLISQ